VYGRAPPGCRRRSARAARAAGRSPGSGGWSRRPTRIPPGRARAHGLRTPTGPRRSAPSGPRASSRRRGSSSRSPPVFTIGFVGPSLLPSIASRELKRKPCGVDPDLPSRLLGSERRADEREHERLGDAHGRERSLGVADRVGEARRSDHAHAEQVRRGPRERRVHDGDIARGVGAVALVGLAHERRTASATEAPRSRHMPRRPRRSSGPQAGHRRHPRRPARRSARRSPRSWCPRVRFRVRACRRRLRARDGPTRAVVSAVALCRRRCLQGRGPAGGSLRARL
jgi:hypothetical protein